MAKEVLDKDIIFKAHIISFSLVSSKKSKTINFMEFDQSPRITSLV